MTTSHLRRVASVSVVALFLGIGVSAPLVEAQEDESFAELRTRAEAGDAVAQYNLGVMYANGNGVPQDYGEAMKWYRRAAEAGDAGAQFHLGFIYAIGDGVPQDSAEAVRWWRRAAEQGLTEAQYNLGVMYDFGNGVPQDDAAAYLWYNLATTYADASDPDRYAETRDRTAARLTPEQRADAQRRAREFFEANPPK